MKFLSENIILTPDQEGRYSLNDEISSQIERIVKSETRVEKEKLTKKIKSMPFFERLKFLFQGGKYELPKI